MKIEAQQDRSVLMPWASKTIGLLLVGGHHHILHLVPIAAELSKFEGFNVIIFVMTDAERVFCAELLRKLGMENPDIRCLPSKGLLGRISPKLSFLLRHLKLWTSLDALLLVERTSTILRYFSKQLPPLIHIPHGAGDRAKSYDSRIRYFDYVLVAGEKDKARMIEERLVTEANCVVTGYIKPYAVRRISPDLPNFFNTPAPVVLYTPHFSKTLSSWPSFGPDLLEAFSKTPELNFIFAPHVRLFHGATEAEKTRIEAYGDFANIHVDLGSLHSSDMTYTRSADIYLGDVSSQIYEFLDRPKPSVFLCESHVQWRNNPDYASWRYGPVCHSVEDVMHALKRADQDHAQFEAVQIKGCRAAKGDPDWDPIQRAAQAVRSILTDGSLEVSVSGK